MEATEYSMTPRKIAKILMMIHLTMAAGVLIFAGVVMYLKQKTLIVAFDTSNIKLLVFPFIAIGAVIISQIIFKKILVEGKQKTKLRSMFAQYQTASIVKYAVIEAPIMIGIIFFLDSANGIFMAIVVLLIAYLILQRPTLIKIESDLELKGELRNQFQKHDEEID